MDTSEEAPESVRAFIASSRLQALRKFFSSKLPALNERKTANLAVSSGLPPWGGVAEPPLLAISPWASMDPLVGIFLIKQRRALFDDFFIEPYGTAS